MKEEYIYLFCLVGWSNEYVIFREFGSRDTKSVSGWVSERYLLVFSDLTIIRARVRNWRGEEEN